MCSTVFSSAESICAHTVNFVAAENQLHTFPYECTRFNFEGAVFSAALGQLDNSPFTEDTTTQRLHGEMLVGALLRFLREAGLGDRL